MSDSHSDALVFFGATGDLAYKKIFPALQAMIKRGHLNVPVIGVAKAGWNLEQLRARAHDSLEKHGGVATASLKTLTGLLRYVDGDYADPATFQAIRKELNGAKRPAHYLAIPPLLFGTVVEQLAKSGSAEGARVIVEKPFGTDLASAQELNRILHTAFPEPGFFRIDHYLGKRPVNNVVVFRFVNAFMEPPVRVDSETIRDEKVKVLKAIPPLETDNLVRGQFRGYRQEGGVRSDSKVETFAALRLEIDSWRWKNVPFYIRAGKNLPVTCTEVLARFRKPPTVIKESGLSQNHLRFRISPEMTIAVGTTVMAPGEALKGEDIEMVASRLPRPDEMDAYERVLGDAMAGDATLFARQDYVEEALRIVDPAPHT